MLGGEDGVFEDLAEVLLLHDGEACEGGAARGGDLVAEVFRGLPRFDEELGGAEEGVEGELGGGFGGEASGDGAVSEGGGELEDVGGAAAAGGGDGVEVGFWDGEDWAHGTEDLLD